MSLNLFIFGFTPLLVDIGIRVIALYKTTRKSLKGPIKGYYS